MQSTSWETLGWKKHKLESRLPGEVSITSDYADDTTLMAESEEELKSLLMKVKEESEKVNLKLNIQKKKKKKIPTSERHKEVYSSETPPKEGWKYLSLLAIHSTVGYRRVSTGLSAHDKKWFQQKHIYNYHKNLTK